MRKPFYLIFKTQFGYAAFMYRIDPFTVVKVFLPLSRKTDLLKRLPPDCTAEPCLHERAIFIKKSIIDYFQGGKIDVSPALLDMKNLTELEQSVLYATSKIPYGKLKTYKNIAKLIQCPRASRFVGNALAKNPFPVLIPCHRVIRSDGSYGKFGGGPDLKRKMIGLEATNCLP